MIKIKTKEDIKILRDGGKRHAEIMKALVAMVKPGLLTSDIEKEARRLIKEGGDEPSILGYTPHGASRPYPASTCISINDEVVHGIPNENPRTLKEGDIVSIDFTLTHKGLITDMAVTVPVGKISKELQGLLETTKSALMAGIKAAKAGKNVGDISSAIERVGITGDYGVVEDLAGHGVGYAVHEEPMIPNYGDPGEGETLQAGMVIAIEPMFNLGSMDVVLDERDGYTYRTADGKPSAHFEHTVLIKKGDAEILTLL
jgi:methionyl aminopeptidase